MSTKKEPLDLLTCLCRTGITLSKEGQRSKTKRHMGSQRVKRLRGTNLVWTLCSCQEIPVLSQPERNRREKDALPAVGAFRVGPAVSSTAQDFYLMVAERAQPCDLYGAGISFL